MKTIPLLLLLLSFFSFADKEEILEQGQELHNQSCLNCHIAQHDKAFYTREDRKMKDFSNLKGQVSRCISAFSLDWFPEEESSVRFYLNHNFYYFSASPTITPTIK